MYKFAYTSCMMCILFTIFNIKATNLTRCSVRFVAVLGIVIKKSVLQFLQQGEQLRQVVDLVFHGAVGGEG